MLNKKDLLDGFSKTNVKKGETIVVHTSYKSLGGVEGGADTVIDVMRELVGTERDGAVPCVQFSIVDGDALFRCDGDAVEDGHDHGAGAPQT